jgi:hypothetical protein
MILFFIPPIMSYVAPLQIAEAETRHPAQVLPLFFLLTPVKFLLTPVKKYMSENPTIIGISDNAPLPHRLFTPLLMP